MHRKTMRLNKGYKLRYYPEGKADPEVFGKTYDDSAWETVRVPHDWEITVKVK